MPTQYDRYGKKQKDPGNAGTLRPLYAHTYFGLVSAAAETRTLARPNRVGVFCTLEMKTDGGDITVTVTGGYDEFGTTVLVLNDVNQFVTLVATEAGGTFAWRVLGGNAVGGGMTKAAVLAGATTLTAAHQGMTLFLDAATEFAVTLPAPYLGAYFKFVVANAPESADYTIVTAGAPDQILAGHVLTSEAAAGDTEAAATGTTITFVDAKAVVGDWAEVTSDGTSWFASVRVAVAAGATITG